MAAPLGRAEKGSEKMSTELKAASRIFFAVTMMCIGAIGLIDASFVAVWAGVPPTLPGRELLLYVCAFLALATGAGEYQKEIESVNLEEQLFGSAFGLTRGTRRPPPCLRVSVVNKLS